MEAWAGVKKLKIARNLLKHFGFEIDRICYILNIYFYLHSCWWPFDQLFFETDHGFLMRYCWEWSESESSEKQRGRNCGKLRRYVALRCFSSEATKKNECCMCESVRKPARTSLLIILHNKTSPLFVAKQTDVWSGRYSLPTTLLKLSAIRYPPSSKDMRVNTCQFEIEYMWYYSLKKNQWEY